MTKEEIKTIDDQMINLFSEEKINEFVRLCKEKKCQAVLVNIIFKEKS
ncbi:MAG: hypothetical protein K0Q49_358 [Haloplasmataceae bacterium]|jgi:cytoplasmic iron level regulating protein YaaA (DUF328/UPF0246 family)|nr:hypothetical protein [Haloplasmataceae bacterium]